MPKVIADITMSLDGYVTGPGGGDVIGQALEQDLVYELRIHLAPMLLGGGTPLFKPGTRRLYRQGEVRPSKNAVHLAYERISGRTPRGDDAPSAPSRQPD